MWWTQERPLTFDTLGRLLLAMTVWQPCLQSQRAGVREHKVPEGRREGTKVPGTHPGGLAPTAL